MSEGPQVRLITERLQRKLQRKLLSRCVTTRANLERFAAAIAGSSFERIFCKGKHIFFALDSEQFLHNQLLMRGRWRMTRDRFMLLPYEIWLAFETGDWTVYNQKGQVLRILNAEQTQKQLDSLGADVMCDKCKEQDIVEALSGQQEPAGELLLDQSVLSGIGNVAKSEALFLAGIHPETEIIELTERELSKLAGSIRSVMWDSYKSGGRWTRRVYRRSGERCLKCGTRIIMIRQGKQNRSTYFCPKCQQRA
ncbi:MAG: hypothetical protein JSU70_18175 [Phycisphaerales bacterium]|nr:MAG: hypothetical protein JSU70_18175 [Phycisphaerales bacterium]